MKCVACTLAALLSCLSFAITQTVPDPKTPEQPRESRRKNFSSGRELLLRAGVPFDPDELLKDDWRRTLKPVLETMPQMRQSRYLTGPLSGVIMADTLYLPEKAELAETTVIIVNHLVFEGTNVLVKGPASLHLFRRYPTEVLGKSLPQTLKEAGFAELAKDASPPSFDQLVQRLGRDPYRRDGYVPVFLQRGNITIDVSGRPGEPGKPGQQGNGESPPPQ